MMPSVFSSWFPHTVIQTNSLTVAVLSPVTHHQYNHFPIPLLSEEYGPSFPLLEKRTSPHTIFLPPLFLPLSLVIYVIYKMHATSAFERTFSQYLDSILLKTRTSSIVQRQSKRSSESLQNNNWKPTFGSATEQKDWGTCLYFQLWQKQLSKGSVRLFLPQPCFWFSTHTFRRKAAQPAVICAHTTSCCSQWQRAGNPLHSETLGTSHFNRPLGLKIQH